MLFYSDSSQSCWISAQPIFVVKVIKAINDSSDIMYHVTKETGNGLISSRFDCLHQTTNVCIINCMDDILAPSIFDFRDFVSVRHWNQMKSNNCMLSVATSVNFPWVVSKKAHIRLQIKQLNSDMHSALKYLFRGDTKLTAWMYESLPNNNCRLKMLIAIDVKVAK